MKTKRVRPQRRLLGGESAVEGDRISPLESHRQPLEQVRCFPDVFNDSSAPAPIPLFGTLKTTELDSLCPRSTRASIPVVSPSSPRGKLLRSSWHLFRLAFAQCVLGILWHSSLDPHTQLKIEAAAGCHCCRVIGRRTWSCGRRLPSD